MHREITRVKGSEFCTLEIRLETRAEKDGPVTRLSICGTAGEVMKPAHARKQALEYWESFFEDDANEIKSMNERCGTNFRSPRSAAKYVLNCDGEYHGLDVTRENSGQVFVGHSFGQIREEIARFFPEAVPYFQWHLNDMHGECAHQREQGITYQSNPKHECLHPDCVAVHGEAEHEVSNAWGQQTTVPTRGYKIGSKWLYEPLPAEVIQWAETFGAEDK